jgi:hypothetical protein
MLADGGFEKTGVTTTPGEAKKDCNATDAGYHDAIE